MSLVERKFRLILVLYAAQDGEQREPRSGTLVEADFGLRAYILTADNGKEFAGHEEIVRLLDVDFCFTRPYASWQRGSGENADGLIWQFFLIQV